MTDEEFRAITRCEAVVERDAKGIGQETPSCGQERVLGRGAVRVIGAETDLFKTPTVWGGDKLIADIDAPFGRKVPERVKVHHVACIIKLAGFSGRPKLGPILQAEV